MKLEDFNFLETLNENETYFGVKKGGNSRFELGASVRAYYKSEIFKNINLERNLKSNQII